MYPHRPLLHLPDEVLARAPERQAQEDRQHPYRYLYRESHGALVSCLVNLFRNWQDLWRPPMLFGFCPELLGRRHARCSVLVPSYVVKGNGLSRQPAQRLSRSYLAGWLAGLDPGRNVRPCSSRKRWWV